jgi:NAD(P)-dependent dehydrogenase (short-subunit alcohol dehydrogenase family)
MAAEVEESAPAVQAALQALPKARYLRHDLLNGDPAALLDGVGEVTCFVSNAGVPARQRGDMLALTAESFDHVMGINLRGAFFLAQEVARLTEAGKLASIGGGGDTVSALKHAGVAERMTYVSAAGGAFLEWLEGKELPGVAALAV